MSFQKRHLIFYGVDGKILLELVRTYRTLVTQVKKQKLFLKNEIEPTIETFRKSYPLDQKVVNKLYKYYGLGVPAILGHLFALPRGFAIDTRERLALTYAGALTGLIDDAFDEGLIDTKRVLEFIKSPKSFNPNSPEESLMEYMGSEILKLLPKSSLQAFKELALNIYELQVKSTQQKDAHLDYTVLHAITRSKGGLPFVLYRYCLNNVINDQEELLVYELGASMQLGNDLFDVYKDLQDQIFTIPNRSQDLEELQSILKAWMHRAIEATRNVNFKNQKDRGKLVSYFLLGMSRCFVCLDQYKKLTDSTGGIFKPKEYVRKGLICDMEKPINILRSILWYYKIKKEFDL